MIVRNPRVQLQQLSGLPFALSQATFFLAGSTTPTPVYSDSACTQAIAQPVDSDDRGIFPVMYIPDALNYRMIIKDALGNLIADSDNLGGIGGGGGGGSNTIVSSIADMQAIGGNSAAVAHVYVEVPSSSYTWDAGSLAGADGETVVTANGVVNGRWLLDRTSYIHAPIGGDVAVRADANIRLVAQSTVMFRDNGAFQIVTDDVRGRMQASGSGNVIIIQNVSGANDYDSAISFNSGDQTQHSGRGLEYGAIGYHHGTNEFPFNESIFFEASNDPESGVTMNPPKDMNFINTGYYNGAYASRIRMKIAGNGQIMLYDGSSVGIVNGAVCLTIPLLQATGVAIPFLLCGAGAFLHGSSLAVQGVQTGAGPFFAAEFYGKGAATNDSLLFLALGGSRASDTTNKLIEYIDTDGGGTARFRVLANGSVFNNGTYGTLSDRAEKNIIAEMPDVSAGFKLVDFSKYTRKDDKSESPQVKYGPMAQDLEKHLPGDLLDFLVSEDTIDADGEILRKHVNITALTMVIGKVVQETIERLDRAGIAA